MRAAGLALIVTALGAGCLRQAPARPQVVVHVDTDAHVPRMFDRLRLEVLDSDFAIACATCSRELAIDERTEWPVAFGVADVPEMASGRRVFVRATLYPSGRVTAGVPAPATTIDRIVLLPPPEGIEERLVLLPMDCVGMPADAVARRSCIDAERPAEPIADAEPWSGAASRAGTWHAGLQRDCAGAPAAPTPGLFDGERCIPGGVFWLGDWRWRGYGDAHDAVPERAVAVSPFFLDEHEYTVGRFRAAVAAGLRWVPGDPYLRDDPLVPAAMRDLAAGCNLYDGDTSLPDRDVLPLNCVGQAAAALACAFEGRRLPSEAEWEWAAQGREDERLFPWGDRAIGCGDTASLDSWTGACPVPIQFTVEQLGGHGVAVGIHDVDVSRDGIRDFAGNMREHVRDAFQPYDGACWQPGAYGEDPVCPMPPGATFFDRSVRGNQFLYAGGPFVIPMRDSLVSSGRGTTAGFRCARDGD